MTTKNTDNVTDPQKKITHATLPMKAVIIGATGLIGSQVLKDLLKSEHCEQVICLTRSPLTQSHTKLINIITPFIDFEEEIRVHLETYTPNVFFCSIGTTIAKAKNYVAFAQIDLHIPVQAGQYCKRHGIERFVVVSAMGASPDSLYKYNRIKGNMEKQLTNLNLSHLIIMRPALLIGDRQENRPMEHLSQKIMPFVDKLLIGKYKSYRSVKSADVAHAMIITAYNSFNQAPQGAQVYLSDQITKIAHTHSNHDQQAVA